MATEYAIPAVGSKVRVTVRFKEHLIFNTNEFRDTVYEGVVLKSDSWVKPTSFCMTGNKDMRVREIGIEYVHALEFLDGQKAKQAEVDSGVTVKQVPGSKPGTSYSVTKTGNTTTCSCVGFQYRRTCKHIAIAFCD